MQVPIIPASYLDINYNERLGGGAEGHVFEGLWRRHGRQSEPMQVAIKAKSVKGMNQEKDRAAILHVATTTFLASENRHFSMMQGVCRKKMKSGTGKYCGRVQYAACCIEQQRSSSEEQG